MIEAVLLMLALPAASVLVAALAVAVEFASLMLFLLLVTGGRKAGRL
jgi:hypothetical protein